MIDKDNINAGELFRNAQRLFIEGKKDECIDVFTKAIEAGEKTEIAFLSRGVAFLKTEQIDNAIEDFSMVVSMNNNNMRAHYYRGIACMSRNDFKNAIKDFNKTIELKPDHGAAFFARGSAYAQLGDTKEAAKNFKTALMYSETEAQGFADTFGIFRTQFDKTLAMMTGEGKMPVMELTDEEIDKLKKWLEE
ncbi:MAG: tetratricopeptide repeat protein [Nitrospirae bacterium]|nr:tetratricopeptide repeat protein [Nitrospirota bacterium]